VPRYLSDEWFDAVTTALAGAPPAGTERPLVLQQIVTGGPDGDVSYALVVDAEGVRLLRGSAERSDATITQDYTTASALQRGQLTLQQAFMAGRVKVRGNMTALMAGQTALSDLDPLPASVRAETTY
jgi:hypothetical protein